MIEARPAPYAHLGPSAWLRRNLFGSFWSSLATVLLAAAALWVLYNLVTWAVFSGSWQQLWNNLKLFAA